MNIALNGINWYSILVTIGLCVLGYITSYIRTKTNLINKAGELINTAEDNYKSTTKQGEAKFTTVCNWLMDMIPAPLKIFITRDMVEKIVQTAFDKMAEFANKQLDKVVDKIVKPGEES